MAESKKYYWLKLKRDFFKRHDIRIIEEMPNGKDYILFYLKLLLESIDHEGNLRFSETIPYNEQMLSVVTNTNVDIVRSAMKIFVELKMMDVLEDKTIYMAEVEKLIGCETEWAKKKRLYREQRASLGEGTSEGQKRTLSDKSIEIDIEKDIDTEKEKRKGSPQKRFTPPSLEEVQAYCSERGNVIDAQAFIDFYASKGWMVGKTKMTDWKAAVRTWESRNRKQGKPTYSTVDYGNPEDIF